MQESQRPTQPVGEEQSSQDLSVITGGKRLMVRRDRGVVHERLLQSNRRTHTTASSLISGCARNSIVSSRCLEVEIPTAAMNSLARECESKGPELEHQKLVPNRTQISMNVESRHKAGVHLLGSSLLHQLPACGLLTEFPLSRPQGACGLLHQSVKTYFLLVQRPLNPIPLKK
jgi:hypothetical protein